MLQNRTGINKEQLFSVCLQTIGLTNNQSHCRLEVEGLNRIVMLLFIYFVTYLFTYVLTSI